MSPELRATVERLTVTLAEHARSVDEQARFPKEGIGALRESGLMGLLVSTRHGGLGADLATFSEVAQRLAAGCASTAMVWAMHCQQVAILEGFASAELKRSLLPRIARGEVYLASVTTDPENGGDPMQAGAPLVAKGDGFTFVRECPVVTGGENADGYLLTLRASEAATPAQVVFVYADAAQVTRADAKPWALLGMRGTRNMRLRLSGEVPRANVLGLPNGDSEIVSTVLIPVGHIAWASCWLGAARGLLEQVVQHLRADKRRRQALGSELLAVRLARLEMRLDTLEVYLRRVVDDYGRVRASAEGKSELLGYGFQRRLNSLKVLASDTAFEVADALMVIAGFRTGYLEDSPLPLERVFRDLRSASLMVGNDRLLMLNGRTLLMGWKAP